MKKYILITVLLAVLTACSKGFLEEIPNSNILTPEQAEDFQRLLDNSEQVGVTGVLPQLAADEYYISAEKDWLASATATERNSYIWAKDIFGGELEINDWNAPYKTIFYANNIINEVEKQFKSGDLTTVLRDIYGQALFHRAKAYFDLLKNFSVPFDEQTQRTDLGVPIRKDPSIDYTAQRATVSDCYDFIFEDLQKALEYLAYASPLPERNRATKLAAFALLSRIHLYRREYDKAEQYADSLLNRYDKLIDYNKIPQTSNTPFTKTNDELIMYGTTGVYRNSGQINSSQTVFVDSTLIKLYTPNDLRLSIYFINNGGKYTVKRGYNGTGLTPFNGFAVDEVLLNKIECLVRRGELSQASLSMERLLLNRYKTGTYHHVAFADQQSALQFVLQERRKELVWRCLRWDDIKRLNKEGRGIVLSRKLEDAVYRLEPNTPGYVFNIPQDEINRSGIIQNIR
ncbi:MAG: RagB/SusD family nutrient uptake outer membrane protein [Sphingobacterium sp.]|jgi:hypothetical protein|nr:RagB/SusD family nutrient uptake outer membrane protein [Sphingobacterium sp.]